MGNALIITGRALGLSGRSLVTDAGGAPCCCGDCGCHAWPQPPPCDSVPFDFAYTLVHSTRAAAGAPLLVPYGPFYDPWNRCCCDPSLPQVRSLHSLRTHYDLSGTVVETSEVVAETGPYPLTVREYLNSQLQRTYPEDPSNGSWPCIPPGVSARFGGYTPVFLGVIAGVIGQEVGWQRFTCDEQSGDVSQYHFLTGRLVARHTFHASVRTDRTPCMGSGCRTCCLPDATCILATPAQCTALFGVSGSGVMCANARCPDVIGTLQACCLPDGSCRDIGALQCSQMGGVSQGPGSTCTTTICPPPPTFACCLPTGGCAELTQLACQQLGGTWASPRHCVENPCPQPGQGACCIGTFCQQMTEAMCATNNGYWRGLVLCSPGLCDCIGACCFDTGGGGRSCTPDTQASCLGSGLSNPVWYGCDFPCEATNNCGQQGGLILPPPRKLVIPSGCTGCGEAAKVIQPWA